MKRQAGRVIRRFFAILGLAALGGGSCLVLGWVLGALLTRNVLGTLMMSFAGGVCGAIGLPAYRYWWSRRNRPAWESENPVDALYKRALKHIGAQELAQAELALRQLIDITAPSDNLRLCMLYSLLADVLNALSRTAEGTEMYRRVLAQARPAPPGVGYTQCLLHSAAAQSLWKLERRDESRIAAQQALEASPTPERRAELTQELASILNAG
jgi:tetratricopeptide (TPR) repeat protein